MQRQDTVKEPRRRSNVYRDNGEDLHAAFAAALAEGRPTRRLLQLSDALLDLLRFDLMTPGGEQLALDLYKLDARCRRAMGNDAKNLHGFVHGLLFELIRPQEHDPSFAEDYARIERERRAELAAWYETADETPARADDAPATVVDINLWRSSHPTRIRNLLFAEKQ